MAARTRTSQFGCRRIFPSLWRIGTSAASAPSRVADAWTSPSRSTSRTMASRWMSWSVTCSVKRGFFCHDTHISLVMLNCFLISMAFRPFDSSIVQTTWRLVRPKCGRNGAVGLRWTSGFSRSVEGCMPFMA